MYSPSSGTCKGTCAYFSVPREGDEEDAEGERRSRAIPTPRTAMRSTSAAASKPSVTGAYVFKSLLRSESESEPERDPEDDARRVSLPLDAFALPDAAGAAVRLPKGSTKPEPLRRTALSWKASKLFALNGLALMLKTMPTPQWEKLAACWRQ